MHYVFYSLHPQESKRPFPFCSGFGELLYALSTLAGKGEICYKHVYETENEAICLLMLEKFLETWFPPLMPLTDHPLLTKWLFSVPFPLPYSYHSWTTSVLKKIRKFFPKDCCQEDDRWSPDNFSSLAPLQTCKYINVGVPKILKTEIYGTSGNEKFGSNIIIQHSLPFVDVKKLDVPESKPDHYSWFLAIQAILYSNSAAFEAAEWKACLTAFANRYRMLDQSLEYLRMWRWATPTTHQEDMWEYWSEEAGKLFTGTVCNDFYFDLFRKMLFHAGFQNGSFPFYIGYVTAQQRVSSMDSIRDKILFVCFRPSWRGLKNKGPICYIGKKDDTYYPIFPNDVNLKKYLVRHAVYQREPYCDIVEMTVWNDDSDSEVDGDEDCNDEDDDDANEDCNDEDDESSVLNEAKWFHDDNSNVSDNDNKKDDEDKVTEENQLAEVGDYESKELEKEFTPADAMSETGIGEGQVPQEKEMEAHDKEMDSEIIEDQLSKGATVQNQVVIIDAMSKVIQDQTVPEEQLGTHDKPSMLEPMDEGEVIDKEVETANAMSEPVAENIEGQISQEKDTETCDKNHELNSTDDGNIEDQVAEGIHVEKQVVTASMDDAARESIPREQSLVAVEANVNAIHELTTRDENRKSNEEPELKRNEHADDIRINEEIATFRPSSRESGRDDHFSAIASPGSVVDEGDNDNSPDIDKEKQNDIQDNTLKKRERQQCRRHSIRYGIFPIFPILVI